MIDFLLGLYFAGLFVRGWVRGFTREAMDLVGLILGLALAFRFSGLVGDALAEWLGISPEFGRLAGGVALFLLVGIGASIGSHYLQKVFTLPGLALTHRLHGRRVGPGLGALCGHSDAVAGRRHTTACFR